MRLAFATIVLAVTVSPALAQQGPVIVIPGRPDIPILMNGVDISWAVIEGDLGLARPGRVTPTVIYRLYPILLPDRALYARREEGPGYFPQSGQQPGYGRLEVEPPPDRPLPPPAPSFRKSWSSQSAPGPVTDYPPYPIPPIGVNIGGGRHDDHDHGGHDHK